MERNDDDRTRDRSIARSLHRCLNEILNLTADVFSFYNNDERLRLYANNSMYSHYVYVSAV